MLAHIELDTQNDEIEWIVNKISELIEAGEFVPPDIAVLCRTNRTCQSVLRVLRERGNSTIRYNVQLKTREKHLQTVARNLLSLFGVWPEVRRVTSGENNVHLGDVVHDLFCTDLDVEKDAVLQGAESLPFPCCPAIELLYHCGHIDSVLRERLKLLQATAEQSVGDIGRLVDLLRDLGVEASVYVDDRRKLVHEIYRIRERYRELVKDGSFQDFLFWLDRISEEKSITVSTAHRSKGHEFKVIFMVGCVQGQWPHYFAIKAGTNAALDDEMRLFYVGCTRAEERLYLTSYRRRGNGALVRESDYIGVLRNLGCLAND